MILWLACSMKLSDRCPLSSERAARYVPLGETFTEMNCGSREKTAIPEGAALEPVSTCLQEARSAAAASSAWRDCMVSLRKYPARNPDEGRCRQPFSWFVFDYRRLNAGQLELAVLADGDGVDAAAAQVVGQLLGVTVDGVDAPRAGPRRVLHQVVETGVVGERQRLVGPGDAVHGAAGERADAMLAETKPGHPRGGRHDHHLPLAVEARKALQWDALGGVDLASPERGGVEPKRAAPREVADEILRHAEGRGHQDGCPALAQRALHE